MTSDAANQAAPTKEPTSPSMTQLQPDFHTTLQKAIRERGIGLGRIRARLQARGTPVSVATLSYWQSGRSRPERPESLKAVAKLEDVLELPSGALMSLLGPRRPRGRGAVAQRRNAERNGEALIPAKDRTLVLLDQMNLPGYRSLTKMSFHDQILIGADRSKRYTLIRQVLRAEQDGIAGFPYLTQQDTDIDTIRVSAITHCRLGTVAVDREANMMCAAILFNAPLRQGDSAMVEFLVEYAPGSVTAEQHERVSTCTIREMLFDIRFAGTPPRSIRRYQGDGDTEVSRDIALHAGSVQVLNADVEPGVYGVSWEW